MHRHFFLSAHKTQIFKYAYIKNLPYVQVQLLVHQFVLIVPCPVAELHWAKPGQSSDTSLYSLNDIDEVPSEVFPIN